jgi:hypothetical protein
VKAAIATAAALMGERAADVAGGKHGSRARWHAIAALFEAFPDATASRVAMLCGVAPSTATSARGTLRRRIRGVADWWREADFEATLEAVRRGASGEWRVANGAASPPTADCPLPTAPPSPLRNWRDAAISTTAALMGDPPPGRSALDRRRAGEGGSRQSAVGSRVAAELGGAA